MESEIALPKQDLPKVLVGCPTSDHKSYCLTEYASAVKGLAYTNYEVLIADNSEKDKYAKSIKSHGLPVIRTGFTAQNQFMPHARDRIIDGRNLLRQKALDEGFDYFLSLEQDVIPTQDIIQRLLSHNKEIVSGLYSTYQNINGQIRLLPLMFMPLNEANNTMRYLTEPEITARHAKGQTLLEVRACGLGCVLIHRSVLEKVKFRYDKKSAGFDDVFFCEDAIKQGFKIYADTGIRCKHLYGGGWDGIKK